MRTSFDTSNLRQVSGNHERACWARLLLTLFVHDRGADAPEAVMMQLIAAARPVSSLGAPSVRREPSAQLES